MARKRARRQTKPKGRKSVKTDSGYVYVLRIELEGVVIYKVGITSRKSVHTRCLEVMLSICESGIGYFPKTEILRAEKTFNHFAMESEMHRLFKEYSFIPDTEFSGHTELFCGMEESLLLSEYDRVIALDPEPIENDAELVW